jgi:hypothetical protein
MKVPRAEIRETFLTPRIGGGAGWGAARAKRPKNDCPVLLEPAGIGFELGEAAVPESYRVQHQRQARTVRTRADDNDRRKLVRGATGPSAAKTSWRLRLTRQTQQ